MDGDRAQVLAAARAGSAHRGNKCPIADEWFYGTESTTHFSPHLWESFSCGQKQQIAANPVIGYQLVELEQAIERSGLAQLWQQVTSPHLPKLPSLHW